MWIDEVYNGNVCNLKKTNQTEYSEKVYKKKNRKNGKLAHGKPLTRKFHGGSVRE